MFVLLNTFLTVIPNPAMKLKSVDIFDQFRTYRLFHTRLPHEKSYRNTVDY